MILKPQAGPQELFLSSPADIAIYGGAAGGGKTYALLLEPLRHINVKGFNATIFRRNATQISIDGGLLDTSMNIYGLMRGANYKASPRPHWTFGNSKISFMHIDGDRDLPKWQGSQICFLGFDELTHFSQQTFFYMLSRNRSTCGVKPYVRATCNPDSDSWLADFIDFWIDQDSGYPIKERSGKLRYFVRVDGEIKWGDNPKELEERYSIHHSLVKSVTFIASSIYDNKVLLERDKGYLANLNGLGLVERERLLKGNWKIRPSAGLYFKRGQTTIVEEVPGEIEAIVRAWDLAATEITNENKNPDRTSGVLMARLRDKRFIIIDVKRVGYSASKVRGLIKEVSRKDLEEWNCRQIRIPQDPGQAGKEQAQSYIRELAGYNVKSKVITGDKVIRAEPLAAQWQIGNVLMLRGMWNEAFLLELEGFPETLHDDQVDAAADAFSALMVSKVKISKEGLGIRG